jgi:ribosomal protein L35AE/L33A/disulfide oxidoreductase YuzD
MLRRSFFVVVLAVLAGSLVAASSADPSSTLSINDAAVTEGDSGTVVATFTVALNAESSDTVTVDYSTFDGSAASPADYVGASGTLTFDPGQTSKTVEVLVNGDTLDEADETLEVNLTNAVSATITDSQGIGTIIDDDAPPALSIDNVTVDEGDAGTTNASFSVVLSAASGQAVTVNYASGDGTAIAPGDYTAVADGLTFAPGDTAETVTVPVVGDALDEGIETYTVSLSDAVNATIADPDGLGTITDDDPQPSLSVGDVTVAEGDAGTTDATFTVALSSASGRSVTVGFSTTGGSATSGTDFTATNGSLTFAAGQATRTVTVPVVGDTLDEQNETFFLNLSTPTNASLGDAQGLGTITDDDPPPQVDIENVTVLEGNTGTVTASFEVTLTPASGRAVTVQYATADANARAPADYAATSGELAIPAGETAKQVTVPVQGDILDEDNETFGVTLSDASGATIGDGSAVGTITDDDPLPTVSIGDVTVTEGDIGSVPATFTATLSSPSGRSVTVHYATANGTATSPADYAVAGGELTFAAGETTKTVAVTVNPDLLDEDAETFTVGLSNPGNATIFDASGVGTITDNDPLPALSIGNATVTEGASGIVNATFTVTLSPLSGRQVTVHYATADGTAGAPGDYTATSGDLTFASGDTSETITVPVKGDLLDEDNETFTVELSNPGNATIADAEGTGTITDDDPLPTLAINDVTVTEGDSGTTDATFTVTMSAQSGRTVTVAYATANASAVAPSDYEATNGSLSFAAGETTKTITVPVNGDLANEGTETYLVNLSNILNATAADAQGVGTIVDDDGAPALSIGDATVTEGDSGSVNATFTVTLAPTSGQTVSVGYTTVAGTATPPGDYTTRGGNLVFTPGQTTQALTVTVNGDLLDEIDETFTVSLSDPVNAAIADGIGLGTITDNDPPPGLSVNDATVAEGDAGTVTATFTVSLNAPSGRALSVDYATADQTATAPADYTAATGTLSFAAGETSKTVPVTVKADLLDEVNETFLLNLSTPSNAVIADGTGVGTITDNDQAPTVSIGDSTVVEGDAGAVVATFDVTLSTVSGQTVTVNYATANGTAAAPADYVTASGLLSFAPGDTTETITVTVNGDVLDEADGDTFSVNLATPVGATLGDGSGVGTITDDDPLPALSVNDVSVTEGNAGTLNAVFTVGLNAPSGRSVSVDYATANGTATAPADYSAVNGALTFAAGEVTKQVTVSVKGDTLDEPTESYLLNLSAPVAATIGDAQGVGTILDDDNPPSITINDATVSPEGNSGTSNATFTVTLSGASGRNVSVGFATADDTAAAPSDYAANGGSVIFVPGDTSETVTVQTKGDTVDELDETFFVTLANPLNATIADGHGVGTIVDDDNPPSISIAGVTVTEGNSGSVQANFTVTLSGASGLPITVDYATADGTAHAPADYTAAPPATLPFNPGVVTRTVTVPVNGDALDEADETFFVNLTNATNATLADTQAQGTITDNDTPPSVSIADVVVTEGNGGTTNATFAVMLSAASGRALSVDYATSPGTATAPADFTATTGTLSFVAGETAKSVSVPVIGDVLDEIDETFTVGLSNGSNVTIGDGLALGTITDDDPLPAVSVNDVTVIEGNSGTVAATFTVGLSAPSGRSVTVAYASADGSATAPDDYTAVTGSLTFAAGETTKTVTVNVKGDTTNEPDETLTLNLSGPVNATILDGQGLGRITDDDGFPALVINDATVTEGNSGTVNAVFTVSLSNPSGQTVNVNYATANGTAVAGADYTSTSGTLSFSPGALTRTITVPVLSDALDEIDETFTVGLTGATNADISDGLGLGTITDNDPLPTLSVNDVTVTEGNSGTVAATFTVTQNAPSGRATTVDYATLAETATSPADFTAVNGTLVFAAAEVTKQVTVLVKGDTLDEGNDTFTLNLTNASNATISDATGVGTITDDDPLPALSIGDATVTEGNAGTTAAATFTVTLSPASGRAVSVDYSTANGTATAPGDYSGAGGTLIFAAGETTRTITVPVNGDALNEPNETFFVNLTGASNAAVTDGQGLGTITDDDGTPSLVVDDVSVVEGNVGTTLATFTVSLSSPSGQTVSVNYATASGSAASPGDFTAKNGSVTFSPGQLTRTISIDVSADALDEVDETYTLNLSNANNAAIADAQGSGTIIDDDAAPTISINDVTVAEGNTTANANFTVTLSAPSGQPVSVGFTTADGTALAPGDYTTTGGNVTFTAGQSSKTVTVVVRGDTLDENDDETFFVNLAEPVNATIADGQGLGTIADNDPLPTLSVGNTTVTESDAGTVDANFTVTLASASGRVVTVEWETTDGTATAADYEPAGGVLTFPAGETTRMATVRVKPDLLDENNETFFVNLSTPSNATVADGLGIGTIVDSEHIPPTVTVDDVSVSEGNSGSQNVGFTISLSARSGLTASVHWATSNGTAAAPSDYTASSGDVTFAAGETTKRVNVPVNGDTTFEADETFTVNLSGAVGATIADGQGLGTIVNDDVAPPPPAPTPPTPPAPPAPPDTTPPREVSNFVVLAGDGKVTMSWRNPRDADFRRVSVVRITPGKTVKRQTVFQGTGRTVTDRRVKNGTTYRYRITTVDQSGNVSAGLERKVTPLPKLFGPLANAILTAPPTLQWLAVKGATYYNVQLWRIGGTGSQAAAARRPTKVLSAWPGKPRYRLARTWRFEGRSYRLAPGRYKWYVWPGLGKRAANKYGPVVGESSFTVKAKKAVKKK